MEKNFPRSSVRCFCKTFKLFTCYLCKLSSALLPLGGDNTGFHQTRRFELLWLEPQSLCIESVVHYATSLLIRSSS